MWLVERIVHILYSSYWSKYAKLTQTLITYSAAITYNSITRAQLTCAYHTLNARNTITARHYTHLRVTKDARLNACKLHEISQLEFSKCVYWDIIVCKKTKRSGSYFVVRFLMSMSGTKCPPFPSQTIPNEYCQPRGTYRLGSQTVLCPRDLTSEDQNYMEACSIPCSYSSYCQSPICVKITIGRGSILSLFNMCWILDREL